MNMEGHDFGRFYPVSLAQAFYIKRFLAYAASTANSFPSRIVHLDENSPTPARNGCKTMACLLDKPVPLPLAEPAFYR
jgi:hypothetical protein